MLTESQIIDALTVLGLPARSDTTFGISGESNMLLLRDSEICRKALSELLDDQETKVSDLIDQWTSIQYDTDTIDAQGLKSDPAKTRKRLASLLANIIGYRPPSTMGGLRIGRA